MRTKTYEEWARIFDEHQNVAVDRFLTPLEAVEHRQVRHNGHVVEVAGLDGPPTVQVLSDSQGGGGAWMMGPALMGNAAQSLLNRFCGCLRESVER